MKYKWDTDELKQIINDFKSLEARVNSNSKKMKDSSSSLKAYFDSTEGDAFIEKLSNHASSLSKLEKALEDKRSKIRRVRDDCYVKCELNISNEIKNYERRLR